MNRARPMAARLKNKPRVNDEPRSAHGRAVNNAVGVISKTCKKGSSLDALPEVCRPSSGFLKELVPKVGTIYIWYWSEVSLRTEDAMVISRDCGLSFLSGLSF